MKPFLFRLTCATISVLFGSLWIECGSFDALFCTCTVISGMVFIYDYVSWANSYQTDYYNTNCGSISYVFFGKSEEK